MSERARPDEHFEEGEETAPPGTAAMSIVRWFLLGTMAIAAALSVGSYALPLLGGPTPAAEHKPKYHCPMHPQIVSDQPGECPICHMALEPIPEAAPPKPVAPRAPMPATSGSAAAGAPPPETAPITLEYDRIQAIGVRTAPVERLASGDTLRVSAAVEVPEGRRAEVHVRAAGFVEAIAVKDVGVQVKAGETLASVYSPEVFQAEQELLAMSGWSGSTVAPPARTKLELLGVAPGAIDKMLASKKAFRDIGVGSPIAGYVTKKNVALGSYVMPDKALFEVAHLSRVYVVANVHPALLTSIHAGDEATFTTSSSDRRFTTKVDLVYPGVDLESRTARVRLTVDNVGLALVPGQLGTLDLQGASSDVLTVPVDAIVDTGRAVYVFVALDGGRFEPRTVELGETTEGRAVVRRGVALGERVVSGATFLIDAESRLEASLATAARAP